MGDRVRFPDISSCDALVLKAKSTTPSYAGFRLSFREAHAPGNGRFAYGYKSNFKATSNMSDIVLPFHGFSDDWNDATGAQKKTCAENKMGCPDKRTLEDLLTISIWGEGVAGKVHLEVASISATGCGSGPSPAGKNIVQLAESVKDLSTLVSALKAGNLTSALSGTPFHRLRAHQRGVRQASRRGVEAIVGAAAHQGFGYRAGIPRDCRRRRPRC